MTAAVWLADPQLLITFHRDLLEQSPFIT